MADDPRLRLVATEPPHDHDGHGPGRPSRLYVIIIEPARDREAPFDRAVLAAGVKLHRHVTSPWLGTTAPELLQERLSEDRWTWQLHEQALTAADTVVLLDSGIDGFGLLELGYAAGLGKRTIALLASPTRPWPAWLTVDYLAPSVQDLIDFLHLVEDTPGEPAQ